MLSPQQALTFDEPALPDAVSEEIFAGLNPRQQEAARILSGPLLVVAGPGSGKTRTLTHRVAALVASGVPPWRILAVTFTNKAALEMKVRIGDLVGADSAERMWVSTFHSACARILRHDHQAAGLPARFNILDEADMLRLLRDLCEEIGIEADRQELRRFQQRISFAKNHNLSVDEVSRAPGGGVVGRVMEAYIARCDKLGVVDFDDLLLRCLETLVRHPDVALRWQQRFDHVLVDEYQDTNRVQYEIVRILAAGHHNLCCVADIDQAIYSFRGALPELVGSFEHDWPEAQVVVLDQNYRSTKRILEVARAVIAPNTAQHRAALWTDNDEGDPVVLYPALDDRDEASWVVDQIEKSVKGGTPLDEHAILVRTNAQTRVLEEELNSRHLAYTIVGALRFYARAEIKDTISWLRVISHGGDQLSFVRAAGAPKRGLGDQTLANLVAYATEHDLTIHDAAQMAVLDNAFSGRAGKALAGFVDALDLVGAASNLGPAAAIRAVLDDCGLREQYKKAEDGETRLENLDELVRSAVAYEVMHPDITDGIDRMLGFLEQTSLVSAEEGAGEDEVAPTGRIQVLTAHSSKGKEFGAVWVVGAEEGLFPHKRSLQEGPAAIAEERRLFYVAVSRAMRKLAISYSSARFSYGGKIDENPPSRFLGDLPNNVVVMPARRRPTGLGPSGGKGGWGTPRKQATSSAYGASWAPNGRHSGGYGASKPSTPVPDRVVPVANGPRVTPAQIGPDTKVRHLRFGDGTVLEVRAARNEARIQFAEGIKTLDLSHAPLELATGELATGELATTEPTGGTAVTSDTTDLGDSPF